MICDENVSGFLRSLEKDTKDELGKIEKYGRENGVPIIKTESRSVLRFVIKSFKPGRILEIGTAIGFSACLMAEYSDGKSRITTIEKDEKRVDTALKNIENSNLCDIITLIAGDAENVLDGLCRKGKYFDMVFLDAAKAQYGVYFDYIKRLLVPGGMLLTDNVLQEGSVAGSKFAVTRRDRTIHKRMREFIERVYDDKDFTSMIIPVGDGMMLSTRTGI